MLVFPDTNIFLHYPVFNGINWCEMCNSTNVKLIVAMPVIHELDDKKDHPELGSRAKHAISEIYKLIQNPSKTIGDGVTLRVDSFDPPNSMYPKPLNPDSNDDRLIYVAKQHNERIESDVYICTEDLGMIVKCDPHGIQTIAPDKLNRLDNPTSKLQKENRQLRQELDRMKLLKPKPAVDIIFLDEGESLNDDKFAFRTLYNPEQFDIEKEVEREKSEIYRDFDIQSSDRVIPHSALGTTARSKIIERIQNYLDKYRAYLISTNSFRKNLGHIVRVKVLLRNDGNRQAEGIEAKVLLPPLFSSIAGGTRALSSIMDDMPEAPRRPKSNAGMFNVPPIHDIAPMPHFDDLQFRNQPNFSISGAANTGYEVILSSPKLVHNRPIAFGDFYLRFIAGKSPTSFQANIEITAENIPDLISTQINVLLPEDL